MLKNIINLLFPPKCIFCNDIISHENRVEVCSTCYKKICFLNDRLIKPEAGQFFDEVICVCEYSGIIKEAVMRYKFFNKSHYHRTFAMMLSDKIKGMTRDFKFDIIICVPLHKLKQNSRGYNQSFLISRILSKELGIEERSYLLTRVKNTESQSTLSRDMRLLNIENAFQVSNPHEVSGKRILLVDDVLTTGSTLSECSRVLKEAGAIYVVTAVVASGRKV